MSKRNSVSSCLSKVISAHLSTVNFSWALPRQDGFKVHDNGIFDLCLGLFYYIRWVKKMIASGANFCKFSAMIARVPRSDWAVGDESYSNLHVHEKKNVNFFFEGNSHNNCKEEYVHNNYQILKIITSAFENLPRPRLLQDENDWFSPISFWEDPARWQHELSYRTLGPSRIVHFPQ